jgi:integrase
MNRLTTHKPFPIVKHNNTRWRVTFAKGELHPTKGAKKDFPTEKEAKEFVKNWTASRNSLGSLSKQITPEVAVDAVKAGKFLPEGVSLEKAAKFTAQQMAKADASTTFRKAYEDFLDWLDEDNRSKRHIRDHKQTLNLFRFLWDKNLTEITREEIEKVLKMKPRSSRNLKIRHLSVMFNHCISKDWIEVSPVARIKQAKPKDKDSEIEILASSDVQKFINSVMVNFPEAIPYFAIAFFAGTRPEEITKLKWENINEKDITITAAVNKTSTLRYTTINSTLRAWLDWHKANGGITEGLIFPKSTKTLERSRRKIVKLAGINWIQDGARKTFASAHYKTHGEAKTITELGHKGNQMLHKHYNKNIRQAEADTYWQILPPLPLASQTDS